MEEFDYNEFEIDISHIKNSDKICWKYSKNPPENDEDWVETTENLFCKLSPVTTFHWNTAKFDKVIRSVRMRRHLKELL